MNEIPPATPAATLILFSEGAHGAPRHLMIERGRRSSFAAGATVFPGGRVEADDVEIARSDVLCRGSPAEIADASARVAAIRETIEETGVAVGLDPPPDPQSLAAWRAALAAGAALSGLLAATGSRIDLGTLTPFARWVPPRTAPHRRFDTRFYLARAREESNARGDGAEATRCVWISARELLNEATAGRHEIIFPTRCNLQRLATFENFAAALAQVRRIPPRIITPRIVEREGVRHLCIPEDAGYPITSEPLHTAMP